MMKSLCGRVLALGLVTVGLGAATRGDADVLVGTWTWSWKDGMSVTHNHVLEVEGTEDKLAARERFDDGAPIRINDLKMTGQKVSFSVQRDGRRAAYSGTLKGNDLIDGLVTVTDDGQANEFGWQAKKQPMKK
jgi:hypothetical protein